LATASAAIIVAIRENETARERTGATTSALQARHFMIAARCAGLSGLMFANWWRQSTTMFSLR